MEIYKIDKNIFYKLEQDLINKGLDADYQSFAQIKANLKEQKILSPIDFAKEVAYCIIVSGFRQEVGKKLHTKIFDYLTNTQNADINELLKIFGNKNKINAILQLWNNKEQIQQGFYNTKTKEYLKNIKGIGAITSGHLMRNLGFDYVKYDIWIQRLGCALSNENYEKIDNGKLHPDIKIACDKMFQQISKDTGEKQGYIDVVLFKSCSQKLLVIKDNKVYL